MGETSEWADDSSEWAGGGELGGVPFENVCVCDADEDGIVIPYRIWVLPNAERMPDLVCDFRPTRGEVPDQVAWCAASGEFAKATSVIESRPVFKESRFTGNFIGRAVADKVNAFLDSTRWATVYAKDPETAQAVADKALEEDWQRRVVWMARGGHFIYATPILIGGTDVKNKVPFTERMVELQRKYAALNR